MSINDKNGEFLLRTWTIRQILPSYGELSNELTAEQNAWQRTKLSPSTESRSHREHSSSRETRLVARETKRKPLKMSETFTADIVTREIKSCRNSNAFGPDKLSIFHLKNLGPRSIEYITALFNLSVTNCQIPAIWKSSLIIPIPKPGKDTSQGSSYWPISLLCPAAKVLESDSSHDQQISPTCT